MKIKFFVFLFFLSSAAAVWYADFYIESGRGLARLTVLDVGQGDAIFIEAPNGNQALIDGGPSGIILSRLGQEMPFWDRTIDLIILTHAHADHVDGLVEVLKRYRVGMVLESGEEYSTPDYHEWHRVIQEKNIPVVVARRGQVAHLGSGADIRVLSPFENSHGVTFKNPHSANVSTRFTYKKTSALLMGDAEKSIEFRLLLENSQELKSDALKIGHHGSKTSSSQEFLGAVLPQIAVISVGRHNRYGHPHQEVLDRLKQLGIRIFRTDEEGNIRLVSDGMDFKRQN